jgi:hypothetical protein
LCEIVGLLLQEASPEAVALELGLSCPHVRNLARVRQHLVPDAWATFERGEMSLKEALRLAALAPDGQRRSLRKSA